MELKDAAVLYKPKLHYFERDGAHFFMDAEAQLDSDGRQRSNPAGARRRQEDSGEIRRQYAALHDLDSGKAGGTSISSFESAAKGNLVTGTRPPLVLRRARGI